MPTKKATLRLRIRIEGHDLPGRKVVDRTDVRVGLQVGKENTALQPGNASRVRWETDVTVAEGRSGFAALRGPSIHGPAGERFLYLCWIGKDTDGNDAMFRRAKLQLDGVPDRLLETAIATGKPLIARLGLKDKKGGPVCASVRPPAIAWSVES